MIHLYEKWRYGPGYHSLPEHMQIEVKRCGLKTDDEGGVYIPEVPYRKWKRIKIPFTPWMFRGLTPFLWNGRSYVRYYLEYTMFGGHIRFWKSRLACKLLDEHFFINVYNFKTGRICVCHHCGKRNPKIDV